MKIIKFAPQNNGYSFLEYDSKRFLDLRNKWNPNNFSDSKKYMLLLQSFQHFFYTEIHGYHFYKQGGYIPNIFKWNENQIKLNNLRKKYEKINENI